MSRRCMRRVLPRSGFGAGLTLIEILIAMAVLGIVIAATVPLLVSTMRSNADNRVRAQAVAATEIWLDRFRAKTLDFEAFEAPVTYEFGYDYGADGTFVAAGDPDPGALNDEWQPFSFTVRSVEHTTDPLLWRIEVSTRYHRVGGSEAGFDVATIVEQ